MGIHLLSQTFWLVDHEALTDEFQKDIKNNDIFQDLVLLSCMYPHQCILWLGYGP